MLLLPPKMLIILTLMTVVVVSATGNHHNGHVRTDIYFAAFFPMTPASAEGKIGRGVMPAVRLAIKHINQSPDILHGYKLHMYWNDTQCNPGVGLKAFFDMVHLNPKKLVLFGAACSPVTDQIAKAAKHWNLVQLTYADSHPMFTEKSFPHFFRVVPSENEFNPPRLSILKYYNWTRVGTLYQNEAKYSLAHNHLVSELEKNNFSVVESQSFNDEITNQLDILIKKDIRIILGNFNETWARHIFCDAYRKGVYGNKYQWLIVGMYEDNWWLRDPPCAKEEIEKALTGIMIMDILPLASSEDITVSKRTPVEYEREYLNVTHHTSRYHGYAYDGVWAAALAIQEVGRKAHLYNTSLADFTYRSKTWEKLFIEALDKTSFEGVTGPVRFKENSRRGNVVIKQLIPHEVEATIVESCIGEYSGVTRTLYLERCGKVFWPGERPPKDQTITRIEDARVDLTIFAALVGIASLGIVLAFSFLIINIKFRNQRQIKMSSPNMNNLIIIGCILTYSSVILLGLDSYLTSIDAFPYICTARAWILMSGFTLSFGSMFSKTWRVHSIFTNVQLNKKVMKDSQLYLVVGMLISIDIITMTLWQVMDPFYRSTKELEPYPFNHENDGIQIIPRIESCSSEHMTIFVGCIYAYKGLLMLFGAFLAWETRHVQIPALNDSKYVGMSVYNVAIMCVLGVAVSFVLKDELNASFIIISIFIIFCTTGTLCLVFVPKLIDLKRDPHGNLGNRGKPTIKTAGNAIKKNPLQTMEDKLRIANKVNKKYHELLEDLDAKFREAINELGNDEAQALLNNRLKAVVDGKKDPQIAFAVDITDISSSYSDHTTHPEPSSDRKLVDVSQPLLKNAASLEAKLTPASPQQPTASMIKNTGGAGQTLTPLLPPPELGGGLNGTRQSTSSANTSDYFSMNSRETEYQQQQMNGHNKPVTAAACIPEVSSGLETSTSSYPVQYLEGSSPPPPPPAMFGSGADPSLYPSPPSMTPIMASSVMPIEPPPPSYADTTKIPMSRNVSSCSHDCHESLDSYYSDEDDEDEYDDEDDDGMEEGAYHLMPVKSICSQQQQQQQINAATTSCHCKHASNRHVSDTQSCHTYEDQATQTEDEDDNDAPEVACLPYDYPTSRKQLHNFSPSVEDLTHQYPSGRTWKYAHSHNHIDTDDIGDPSNQVGSQEILPSCSDRHHRNGAYENGSHTIGRSIESKRVSSSRFNSARSCPDMSMRCDIIEYL